MRKVAGLFAFVVLALVIAACSAPADEPATKWVAFLDKHKAAINAGNFDEKAFEAEGKPLVEELKKHRDPTEKKLMMTEKVLAEWKRANTEFGEAADKLSKEKGDLSAALLYVGMINDLTGEGG